jgi:osmoprotectant transport system permease protein
MSGLGFIAANREQVWELARQHLVLVASALSLSCLIGIGFGIVASRKEKVARVALAAANIGQSIPSIAVLGAMVPLLGVGFAPALVALTLRGILPIYLNTHLGLSGVDPAVREAALGTGLRASESLWMVEVPLASPVIMAGVRTAAVEGVGIATLAAFIGAGGLGDLILQGIAMIDSDRLLGGAIPVALLAVGLELCLGAAEIVIRRRYG